MRVSPRRVLFVGVSTAGSAVFALFPEWARLLGMQAELQGVDVAADGEPHVFRSIVERTRAPDVLGAVITGHKTRIFEHGRDLLQDLDSDARLCREISVIAHRGNRLVGAAIDPPAFRGALAEILVKSAWRGGSALVLFGAGGAATALLAAMFGSGTRMAPPDRVVVFDIDARRLEIARSLMRYLAPTVPLELHLASSERGADATDFSSIAPGSLLVNATGLGKDRAGSPLGLPAAWPTEAIVWDLNYRGELSFLRDAQAQAAKRRLSVWDGWPLFIRGWSEALERLRGTSMTDHELAAMRSVADNLGRTRSRG